MVRTTSLTSLSAPDPEAGNGEEGEEVELLDVEEELSSTRRNSPDPIGDLENRQPYVGEREAEVDVG